MRPFPVNVAFLCCLLSSSAILGFAARQKREILPDKKTTVLITGASSGIGKSTALKFGNNTKYTVYATMRNIADWDQPAQDNIIISQMDVTSEESVQKAVDAMIAEEGHIDIVVNNAGYAVIGCLEAVTVQEAQQEFNVNVWGAVRVLQAVLPHMRSERRGHVINLRYAYSIV
jgi:NADP-dependent 3-hydroxy acid dehydrogenase YdfG